MIDVRAQLAHGRIQLVVAGHENHQLDGRVCAAVSAITHTALLGLTELARQYPDLVTVTIEQE